MKSFIIAMFLLLALTFIPYALIYHGWAGVVASIIWGVIMFFGLAAAISGEGGAGGLVGVFIGWIAYVVILVIMALTEQYFRFGSFDPKNMDEKFAKGCLAGRVAECTYGYGGWVYTQFTTSHELMNLYVMMGIMVFGAICVIANIIFRAR